MAASRQVKTSDEITETLLEAVDTVIGARLARLPYDKTIVCTIVDDSQSGIGKYRVPHGLQPTRLLHPWDSPGKSTGVGCHCRLGQRIQNISRI